MMTIVMYISCLLHFGRCVVKNHKKLGLCELCIPAPIRPRSRGRKEIVKDYNFEKMTGFPFAVEKQIRNSKEINSAKFCYPRAGGDPEIDGVNLVHSINLNVCNGLVKSLA